MKIVFLDASTANKGDLDWGLFEAMGEVSRYDLTAPDQTSERIADADIIVTNKVRIESNELEAASELKLICVLATGTDIVDIRAAAEHGIPVCNVPDYSSDSVAQTAFALLLELTHGVGRHSEAVHEGEWSQSPRFAFWKQSLVELAGKTLLIVGMGNIGNKVAQIGEAFGMKVLATSLRGTNHDNFESIALDKGLAQADVVSLHCPLNEDTKQMVNEDWLSKMKPSAFLINTARGGLVHDSELARALENKVIAGYAADVLSSEPPPPEHPLLSAPNCILTPHYAWASLEARQRLWQVCADNIRSFLDGSPKNVIESPH